MNLNSPIIINKKTCKNRIVLPPLVCANWADDMGYETVNRADYYRKRAIGSGLVIVEATAISPDSRIRDTELGLWESGHTNQFNRIAESCHKENSLVLIQLVHAGYNSISTQLFSSSNYQNNEKIAKALSEEQIVNVKNQFVSSAILAYKSGVDGVEVHGAHTYLLNQFTSNKINKRTDCYGGSIENRIRLVIEIIEEIRANTSPDFIIGYRLGVNDPTFSEEISLIKALEAASVDFINVSSGYIKEFNTPESFPYDDVTYLGVHLSKYTDLPVSCVYNITTKEKAENLVSTYKVPMIASGRAQLADPYWAKKILDNIDPIPCLKCKSGCLFSKDGRLCPQKNEKV